MSDNMAQSMAQMLHPSSSQAFEMSRLTVNLRTTEISRWATLEVCATTLRPSRIILTRDIADIPDLRPMLQNYLACGDDKAESADFFSLNVYEWCGKSSFGGSGYDQLVVNATDLQIPIFISETGCIHPRPRLFTDQASIFGKDMNGTWSGAIVYEWIQEANDYGLISYAPTTNTDNPTALDGYVRSGTPTPISPDYPNLKSQWATLSPTGVALSDYSASASSLKPIPCPSSTLSGWIVNPTVSLPSLGETLNPAATATGGLTTGSATPSTTKKGAAPAGIKGGQGVAVMSVSLVCVLLGALVYL